jgi:hypothetical protein
VWAARRRSGTVALVAAIAEVEMSDSSTRPEQRTGVGREPFFRAKVTIPPLPSQFVWRPRIVKLIADGVRGPFTLVTGPPGSGKTLAIAEWAANTSQRVAWVTLAASDNRPEYFWSHVVSALRQAGAALSDAAASLARGEPVGSTFLLQLAQELPISNPPIVLVFDDLHLVTEPATLAGLSLVLRNAKAGLSVIAASRIDPLLPLRAYRRAGELTEIRGQDLAFTLSEADLLMAHHGVTLSADTLKGLTQRTEGWAAGLRLAALSMSAHPDPETLAKNIFAEDSGVAGYLIQEVFDPQPGAVRELLLSTSILDRVSADIAAEMIGDKRADAALSKLAGSSKFVVPLGDGWYRYHNALRDMLRLKLRREDPGRLAELHRRAARWYAQAGDLSDALRHAGEADDGEPTLQIDESAAQEDAGNKGNMATWPPWSTISSLPHGQVTEPPGPSGSALPSRPGPDRYLIGELPSRVTVGRELSLIVSIATELPDAGLAAVLLTGLEVGPEGAQVTLIVRQDAGLVPLGELQETVTVPQHGDCSPIRFAFRARAVGLSRVRVTAWLGGKFLAALRFEVSVESENAVGDTERRGTPIGPLRADPGEVTLQVHFDGTIYSFQLLSQKYLFGPVVAKSLTEDPGQAVERTVAMLRRMAADTSGYTPALAARWVRETGTGLWRDLVPDVIKEQFWQLRNSITSFNIACEDDTMPWELLYPLTRADDAGFLVEQFPVLRRVYGQCRSDRILIGDTQYVVPPGPPGNAQEEVAAICRIFGQSAGSVITNLADLLDLLDAGRMGLLHFACHNTFSLESGGSSIKMVGGAFVPQLLNSAVARHCLADRSPLIFINACRSAGVSPQYTQMMGWASQFMAAGAGAFLGTLWPVRSSQASQFAEAFYTALVDGADLGQASLTARQETKDDADPTWLAYSAYGDPAAVGASEL